MKNSTDFNEAGAGSFAARGIAIMAGSVLCFTFNSLLLKYLSSRLQVDPSVALLFRAAVGALVVTLFLQNRRPLEIIPVFCDRGLVSRGILGLAGTAAYYYTVDSLGPGKATIIGITYVLFSAVIAAFVLKERLGAARFGWIILASLGILLLVEGRAGSAAGSSGANRLQETVALAGAIAAAFTVVLIRQLTFRFSNGTIFMAQCLWIGIPVLPFCFPHFSALSPFDCAGLSVAALLAAGGQLMMNEGFRRLPVASGGSIQMTWPLTTSLGGWLLFGETFGALQLTGAAMILLGTWKVATGGYRPARRSDGVTRVP